MDVTVSRIPYNVVRMSMCRFVPLLSMVILRFKYSGATFYCYHNREYNTSEAASCFQGGSREDTAIISLQRQPRARNTPFSTLLRAANIHLAKENEREACLL